MSERALKRILVLAAVVVAAYAVTLLFRGGSGGGENGGPLAAALEGLEPGEITAVSFVRDADTVRLERSAEGWRVEGYPADSTAVANFLDDLAEGEVSPPVARNPENHLNLGVAEDGGVVMTISREGGEPIRLVVGDAGPSFPSVYARLPEQDAVHLLEARVRGPARRDVEQWRDKEIVTVDTASVGGVDVTREGSSYSLARTDDGWTIDGGPADPGAVSSLLGGLSPLTASGFAPDTATLGDPARRLVVRGRAGDTLTVLSAHRSEGSTFRISARGDSEVYEVSSYRVDRLTPDAESLRAPEGDGS